MGPQHIDFWTIATNGFVGLVGFLLVWVLRSISEATKENTKALSQLSELVGKQMVMIDSQTERLKRAEETIELLRNRHHELASIVQRNTARVELLMRREEKGE